MYKVVWFARYTPNKPKAESDRYWAEVHGPLFAKVPGVERYVQSHVTGTCPAVGGYSEDSTYFDGYSCAWFTDKAAFEAAMLSPEWQAVGEDSANVFDDTWFTGMSAHIREVTQIEGASNPYKVVYVVNFRDGMSREDADEHWTNTHGPLFHTVPDRPLRAEPRGVGDRAHGRDRRPAGLLGLLGVLVRRRGAVPRGARHAGLGGRVRRQPERLRREPHVGRGAAGGRGQGPAARRLTDAPGARAQVLFASGQDARVRPAYGRLTVRSGADR